MKKKKLLYLVKLINHFTNSTLPAKTEAKSIVDYLFYKTDILHVIEVNEEINIQLKEKLLDIRKTYSEVIEKIDEIYPQGETKIIHNLND